MGYFLHHARYISLVCISVKVSHYIIFFKENAESSARNYYSEAFRKLFFIAIFCFSLRIAVSLLRLFRQNKDFNWLIYSRDQFGMISLP